MVSIENLFYLQSEVQSFVHLSFNIGHLLSIINLQGERGFNLRGPNGYNGTPHETKKKIIIKNIKSIMIIGPYATLPVS
jgi:hypothetical protein